MLDNRKEYNKVRNACPFVIARYEICYPESVQFCASDYVNF